jgi:phosphopantothenoylcysteine decarboxylase/phosphopantothenate--cysteine ligase
MLQHPATIANIEKLKSFGNLIIEPESGELASGLEGKGRMAEPETIAREVIALLSKKKRLT